MIYCSCGGQKSCFKCDGKGWLEADIACEMDGGKNFPPVLKEYSAMPEARMEKAYRGRTKPLIAPVRTNHLIPPRSASNLEAKRAKEKKLRKAAKIAATRGSLPAGQAPAPLKPKLPERSKASADVRQTKNLTYLSVEQREKLTEHQRKLSKLIEALASAGDVASKVELRIQDEKKAIRKLHSKARGLRKKANLALSREGGKSST